SLAASPATHLYHRSLHDALPICGGQEAAPRPALDCRPDRHRPPKPPPLLFPLLPQGERGKAREILHERGRPGKGVSSPVRSPNRSEEHTSELQSRENLVCRLLLE